MIKFTLFLLLLFAGEIAKSQTTIKDSSYPPPGRLIDVGGRKLHLLCSGKGSPKIILVAGGGAFAIDWTLVQSRIDSTTRVCSYDRAGLGWSDPGPQDETVEQTVGDLHHLLQIVGEKPPYILVGASIGGIFIQAYQRSYPSEVAGLVFSNSSNRVGLALPSKTDLLWNLTEDEIKSIYPIPPPENKGNPPSEISDPFDRLPPRFQAMWLSLTVRLWENWTSSTTGPECMLSWRKEFLREFEETERNKNPPLGKLPVIVLSGDPAANDSVLKSRDAAGGRLDFLSSNTIHITATGTGHEIHLYQPGTVVIALKEMLYAIRNHKPLSAIAANQKDNN
jgi:pimeloyl-ACP methyl ester carboxylesterase